jgi:hypothetical protein
MPVAFSPAKLVAIVTFLILFLLEGVGVAFPGLGTPARRLALKKSDAPVLIARRHRGRKRTPVTKRPRSTPAETVRESPRPSPRSSTPPTEEPGGGGGGGVQPGDTGALQRGARVEFDGRLVQGQTAKSGAIYLFARKRSQPRSMVKERVSYEKEILRTVYPDWNEAQ